LRPDGASRAHPAVAKIRGLYFRSIDTALSRAGRVERYHTLFPERFAAVLWHPVGEFLTRLAVGGSLLTAPNRVHEGMFEIGRRNAVVFAESLLGRTLLRLLSRDPKRLLQQAVAGRRQSHNYGRWTLELPEERKAVMTMVEKYLYIESYLLGAAQGTFDAVGVTVRAEAKLDDRFTGRHVLRLVGLVGVFPTYEKPQTEKGFSMALADGINFVRNGDPAHSGPRTERAHRAGAFPSRRDAPLGPRPGTGVRGAHRRRPASARRAA